MATSGGGLPLAVIPAIYIAPKFRPLLPLHVQFNSEPQMVEENDGRMMAWVAWVAAEPRCP
jgi:hypothetical protein